MKRINFKLVACLLYLGFLNLSVYSQTKTINISKNDLNNWALDQQEQLFMDVSNKINSGELTPIGISKDSALKFITYIKFDNYDFIKVGLQVFDTSHKRKFFLDNNTPPLIQKKGSRIELKSKYYNSSVYFKESEWKSFIVSKYTRNIFWHFYFKNAILSKDSLEKNSERLFLNLSALLIMEINKGQNVYKDPNLKTPIDSLKDIPLKTEIIQFIETDTDDLTLGYDSVYYIDALQSVTERHLPIEIIVILNIKNLKINIQSLGKKYNSAYINYEALFPGNKDEKNLLRSLIDYKLIN